MTQKDAEHLTTEQEPFKKAVGQAVHDIRSSLAGLRILLDAYENELPLDIRTPLQKAITRISNIASGLLGETRK